MLTQAKVVLSALNLIRRLTYNLLVIRYSYTVIYIASKDYLLLGKLGRDNCELLISAWLLINLIPLQLLTDCRLSDHVNEDLSGGLHESDAF